jgi:hypothetical protein
MVNHESICHALITRNKRVDYGLNTRLKRCENMLKRVEFGF